MRRILPCYLAVFLVLFSMNLVSAQVIRKNWRELTAAEKGVYVSAVRALYTKMAPGTTTNMIETYVATHGNSAYVRHFNADFLTWHRMFLYYFEIELKNSGVAGASNIAIPYWAWNTPGDWSSTSTLFSSGSNNMGLFGLPIPEGTFTRYFGQSSAQPTSSGISNLVDNLTSFGTDYNSQQSTRFWPALESTYHGTAHVFVGGQTGTTQGTMANITTSPRDPVFYQHHGYVDKIWQDWHNKNGSSSIENQSVLINTVPGSPQIARSGTVDSRSLKVWYAENGEVKLNSYTVSGTENYRYTGIFTVASTSSFTVPSGTICNMLSGGSISLKPGFTASAGSQFSARIDPVSSPSSVFNTAKSAMPIAAEPAATKEEPVTDDFFSVAPNPSTGGIFEVSLLTNNDIHYQYFVRDMLGNKIIDVSTVQNDKFFKVDLSDKPAALYLIFLRMSDGQTYMRKVISR
ncbi:tyrosinase family protein [Chryseolinea sp. T2]|uniref:tyrosinase family protein n=1 Tax=Chryseolinea sp. T2 TaxID=3129255 RepID=UPI0030783F60